MAERNALGRSLLAEVKANHPSQASAALRAMADNLEKIAVTVQADPSLQQRFEDMAANDRSMAVAVGRGNWSRFADSQLSIQASWNAVTAAAGKTNVAAC
jgi:hypothetical protein